MAEKTQTRKGGPAALEVPYPSKVSLPVRRPAIVHRQRLIDALTESLQHRLTLVSAPAGYGKTTLLLDFSQSWNQPVCWYALDERDCDLHTFLRYVVAAGRSQYPLFGEALARAMEAGSIGSAEEAVDLLVEAAEAVEELREWCKERLAPYKLPTQVEFRQELPKTTVGKILRRELVRQDREKVT